MKPQCNTSADCLRELARVMDQFGFSTTYDVLHSPYVLYDAQRFTDPLTPEFECPELWKFAIAEVEGKPVFLYDILFDAKGTRCQAIAQSDTFGRRVLVEYDDKSKYWFAQSELSWNPPKPATVMVELSIKSAEQGANFDCSRGFVSIDLMELKSACKTALEKLK